MKNTSLIVSAVLWLCSCLSMMAAGNKVYVVQSPDKQLKVEISAGTDGLIYSVYHKDSLIVVDSKLGLIQEGKTPALAGVAKVISAKTKKIFQDIDAPFYRFKSFQAVCNEMNLKLRGDYGVYFRVYNEGVAYRFYTSSKENLIIKNEIAEFRFAGNYTAYLPYSTNKEKPMAMAFQNTYEVKPLSEAPQELAFLPVTVDCKQAKVTLLESDLEAYPGMFVQPDGKQALKGVFAPYPKKTDFYPWRKQEYVTETEDYIARVKGNRTYPWRILAITEKDTEMPVNNLVYALASPNRIGDCSWVKPGKVAWDWWNAWNLDGVDFVTGVNNPTYKAYIDFASANGIEYVILDEGWAVNLQADLMQVVKEIDLKELVDYAASKNVGIILWAGYHAFERDMENVCRHYAEMGVKGFKVDFMDRDDQEMTAFNYRAAEMCAKYKLILDLHGTHKPAGLNRTYPNVLNFEGVNGLEQMKWSPASLDQVKYDVMIPFIRQVSGPMDYTQGAMRNASKGNYYPCNSEPMSQGTRCRQLALYVVFESPFNMLCDNPSNYMREPESTDFIAAIPTVWDESIVLDGKMGEYIVTARRKGDVWYIGGITDWTARDIEVDCSFLGDKAYNATLFKDGVNAHRVGRDYKRESFSVKKDSKLKIHLAPGGGFALQIK